MTHNQIEYWKLKENIRANQRQEELIPYQKDVYGAQKISYLAGAEQSRAGALQSAANADYTRARLAAGVPLYEAKDLEAKAFASTSQGEYNAIRTKAEEQLYKTGYNALLTADLANRIGKTQAEIEKLAQDTELSRQNTIKSAAEAAYTINKDERERWSKFTDDMKDVYNVLLQPAKGLSNLAQYVLQFVTK